jgi:hypothetical protein
LQHAAPVLLVARGWLPGLQVTLKHVAVAVCGSSSSSSRGEGVECLRMNCTSQSNI